jgi:hypothetical protein
MTSAPSTARARSCPECGVAISGGREACQHLFNEVLAKEFSDYRYFRTHRLTVDVYSLQHPAEYMRSAKSYAAHLTGMYAAIEEDGAAETNRVVQRWLDGPIVFPRPDHPPPRQRGVLSILYVHGAVDPEDHIRRVREWAVSTWQSWREYHEVARRWVENAREMDRRSGASQRRLT